MTEAARHALEIVDCWNSAGVKGDRSCPRLAEVRHCHNCAVFADAARRFLNRAPPAGYQEELTRLVANGDPEPAAPIAVSAVLFEIGEQTLAVDTVRVVEVTEPRPVHRIGHRSSRVFSGLVNVHGQLELCASLRGLLQIAAPAEARHDASRSRLLLVDHAERRWVFEADAVLGVFRFSVGDVYDVPATSRHDGAGFVRSVLAWQGRRVGHLDLDRVFAALERSAR